MLKGVSRQIVDIPQPESAYFERAIFFVKPEFADISDAKLRIKADEMVKSASAPPKNDESKKKKQIADILRFLISAACGACVALLIEMLIK